MPGFIGVRAYTWVPVDASPPDDGVEVYFHGNNNGTLYVGLGDGTVEARDVWPGDGYPTLLRSFADRQRLISIGVDSASPPYIMRLSTDGGVTGASTNIPLATEDDPGAVIEWFNPEWLGSETDWFQVSDAGGEGGVVGGVFHNPDGVAGTVYGRIFAVGFFRTMGLGDGGLFMTHDEDFPNVTLIWSAFGSASANVVTTSTDEIVVIGQFGEICCLFVIDTSPSTRQVRRADHATVTTPTGIPATVYNISPPDAANGTLMTTTVDVDGHAQIWKSTDNGASFTLAHEWDGAWTTGGGSSGQAPPVTACPAVAGVWWCAWATDGDGLGLWRTADDGANWAFVSSPIAPGGSHLMHGAGHPPIVMTPP